MPELTRKHMLATARRGTGPAACRFDDKPARAANKQPPKLLDSTCSSKQQLRRPNPLRLYIVTWIHRPYSPIQAGIKCEEFTGDFHKGRYHAVNFSGLD